MTILKAKIIKLAAVITAVFLILSIFLSKFPGWLEQELSRRWSSHLGGHVSVHIKSSRPWELFSGKVKLLEIKACGIKFKGMRVENIEAKWGDMEFKVPALIFQGQLKVKKLGRGAVKLQLTENDLNAYLQTLRFSGLVNPRLELLPSSATIKTELPWGKLPPLYIKTQPYVAGPSSIGFRAVGLEIAGWHPPRALEKSLLSKVHFTLGWEGLPFPVKLNKVYIRRGKLIISGNS